MFIYIIIFVTMDATVFTMFTHYKLLSIIIFVKDGCHRVHNVHTLEEL